MWLGLFNYSSFLWLHHLKYSIPGAPERTLMCTLAWNRTLVADFGQGNIVDMKVMVSAFRGSSPLIHHSSHFHAGHPKRRWMPSYELETRI